jgi:NAD(P)-dependent dehydrogenase (short-subunit alcohol dehydrogenase family)
MQTASFLKDLFDLSGKTAVVIGGTGELCGTMAVGLARAGAEVVLGGRIPEKAEKRLAEIESYGGKGYFVPVDVTSRESLQHLLDTTLERSGQVDILINGAGTNSPTPFLDIPEDEYQRIIDTNLSAVFRACQVFGSYFIREARAASIINLGSISGLNPLSRVFTYSLSKAAVHNLTRNLAREWGDKDIRVNTLVPGFFPAEQNRKVLDESRVLDILRQTPASRFGNCRRTHRRHPAARLRPKSRARYLERILPEAYAVVKNAARRMCGTTITVCDHPIPGRWSTSTSSSSAASPCTAA